MNGGVSQKLDSRICLHSPASERASKFNFEPAREIGHHSMNLIGSDRGSNKVDIGKQTHVFDNERNRDWKERCPVRVLLVPLSIHIVIDTGVIVIEKGLNPPSKTYAMYIKTEFRNSARET